MSVYLISTRDSSSPMLAFRKQEISSLLEKKQTLIQEVERLKRMKQEIESRQQEILADLRRQQEGWDVKNRALQAKNIQKQTCNRALKTRESFLSQKLWMHTCIPARFAHKVYNALRAQYRAQNPGASPEAFFIYLQ
ncbi:MAG: hypothetical protein K2X08_07185 [Chlamydiales bacterium]|nr:hypothetical protein [Chlamydiales bacterium]